MGAEKSKIMAVEIPFIFPSQLSLLSDLLKLLSKKSSPKGFKNHSNSAV